MRNAPRDAHATRQQTAARRSLYVICLSVLFITFTSVVAQDARANTPTIKLFPTTVVEDLKQEVPLPHYVCFDNDDTVGLSMPATWNALSKEPPPEIDLYAISSWNYFPSASSYYVVGYEDLYPGKGDYDFNDLTVA